jgi:hypothetical protein
MSDMKSKFEVQQMKGDGYEIFYIKLDKDINFGWAEYENALFISDTDTLQKLPDYYKPSAPAADVPDAYNFYCSFDLQKTREVFGDSFKDYVSEAVTELGDIQDPKLKDMVDKLSKTLTDTENLGSVESVATMSKDGVSMTVKLKGEAGPIVLQLKDILEAAAQESKAAEQSQDAKPSGQA